MDFDSAIQAHSNWKIKLFGYASGASKEKLDPVAVGKDNACALGQWLYGDGKKAMAGSAEYGEVMRAHADFHRQAAALVRMIEAGQQSTVIAQLNDGHSRYRECSQKVVGLLMKLKSASLKVAV